MSYELNKWNEESCSLEIEINKITQRDTYSREINELEGEGGALNANFQTAEAIAMLSNYLGQLKYAYNRDVVFKTVNNNTLKFYFIQENKPTNPLEIRIDELTQRDTYSREINELEGEGGALNANFQTAEAIAMLSNYLGQLKYTYNQDFIFKTARNGMISLDLVNKTTCDSIKIELIQKGIYD